MPNTCGPFFAATVSSIHDAQPMPIEVERPTDVLEQPASEAPTPRRIT